jgi:hypothetical protein
MSRQDRTIQEIARLPAWTDFLFWSGARADLEETRERCLSQGSTRLQVALMTYEQVIFDNVLPRAKLFILNIWQNKQLNSGKSEVKKPLFSGVWPKPYPGFEFLEEPFFDHHYKNSIVMVRVALLLGLFLYTVFGILDIYCIPSSTEYTWIIRYACVTPIIIISLISTFLPLSHRVSQLILSFMALSAGYGIIFMVFLAKPNEIAYQTYYTGLILVLIFLYTVLRLRLAYATTTGLLILFGYEAVAVFWQHLLNTPSGIALFVNNNFFFVSASILGFLSCAYIEKAARNEYVMRHIVVAEVFLEFRHFSELYDLGEKRKFQEFLRFLSSSPRTLEEMILNYQFYKDIIEEESAVEDCDENYLSDNDF